MMIFFAFFVGVQNVNAEEYQCVVTSTRADGCGAYYEVRHVCVFPEELNTKRTQEKEVGKLTYPEFCSVTCADASSIPKECRKGAITPLELQYKNPEEDINWKNTSLPFNRPPQVGYAKERGVEIVYSDNVIIRGFQKILNWFKERHEYNTYEIQPATTPVAGVRG